MNEQAYANLRATLTPPPKHRVRFIRHDFSAGLELLWNASFDHCVSGLSITYAESWSEKEERWTTDAYDRVLARGPSRDADGRAVRVLGERARAEVVEGRALLAGRHVPRGPAAAVHQAIAADDEVRRLAQARGADGAVPLPARRRGDEASSRPPGSSGSSTGRATRARRSCSGPTSQGDSHGRLAMRGLVVPLSRPRRLICDLLHFAAGVPTVPVQRRMKLAPVVAARRAARRSTAVDGDLRQGVRARRGRDARNSGGATASSPGRTSTSTRRSVAAITVERDYRGEKAVLHGPGEGPRAANAGGDRRGHPRTRRSTPMDEVKDFRRSLRICGAAAAAPPADLVGGAERRPAAGQLLRHLRHVGLLRARRGVAASAVAADDDAELRRLRGGWIARCAARLRSPRDGRRNHRPGTGAAGRSAEHVDAGRTVRAECAAARRDHYPAKSQWT